MSQVPIFSIIVPSRGRPEGLRRLLESFEANTRRVDHIELVLVADEDDKATINFQYSKIPLKRVIVRPGLNMGALNMAGYEVVTGKYIMLLNDDVIVRTRGWDEKVLAAFKSFPDEIALVHVNDKIFQDKLCTFPFLSRTFCELAGGICPPDYVRYRIDDHIYNVFNLLSVLGRTRILYLPDVIFEHTNIVTTEAGFAGYKPNEAIHAVDTKRFDDLLPSRKELAVRLAGFIDQHLSREIQSLRKKLLDPVTDSVSLRLPEHVRISSDHLPLTSDNTRVTIGIVSADVRNEHSRICLERVKTYTKNFDLIVLDNNKGGNFNHSREMNRILSICKTDYLVLMDDDVFVEPGWLDGMLRCMDPTVGVVTPLHTDGNGNLSYAGIVMRPDYTGHHTHCLAVPERPLPIQTLCSAIMLIDVRKCGHLRIDESYSKYFLDIDYGLRVWEAGFSVVCSPYTMVTHIGGATLQQGGTLSNALFEQQRQSYVRAWIQTKRYKKLERDVWAKMPIIQALLDVPSDLDSLLNPNTDDNRDGFCKRAHAYFDRLRPYPALIDYSRERVWDSVGEKRPCFDDPELGHLGFLLSFCGHPVLIEQNCDGLNIILWNGTYYAIPQSEGSFDVERVAKQGYSRSYQSTSLDLLKAFIAIDHRSPIPSTPPILSTRGPVTALPQPNLTEVVQRHFRSVARVIQVIREERMRSGAWRPAFHRAAKLILRRLIISLWGGDAFERLKLKWRAMRSRAHERGSLSSVPPFLWMTLLERFRSMNRRTSDHSHLAAETLGVSMERARAESDVQKWLDASPVTRVESAYSGYSIYRFEYKFFAIPESAGAFDYDAFKQGAYSPCVVGHTLSEVHAGIDRLVEKPNCPQRERGLFLACLPPAQLTPYIESSRLNGPTTILAGHDQCEAWSDCDCIKVDADTLNDWARLCNSSDMGGVDKRVLEGHFSHVIMPWSCPETGLSNSLDGIASKLTRRLDVIYPSGERRVYEGENLHRLWYNKAYLASMFHAVGSPKGKTVLEVGCSDGLVCDIVSLLGAKQVLGIDVMKTVGCNFPSARVEYQVRDAGATGLPDQSFDLVYSIATLEHVPDPARVLREMLRVTKVGGYAYVQAGPLYHSPFGHHMFAYFQDYPWIHLRKSKQGIKSYARELKIDKAIERDLSVTCDKYVEGMLNSAHVNGLFLEEYRLNEFKSRDDIKVVKFHVSYEGHELLTADLLSEMPSFNPDRLVEHGFEIAFQRLR